VSFVQFKVGKKNIGASIMLKNVLCKQKKFVITMDSNYWIAIVERAIAIKWPLADTKFEQRKARNV
jgi:hypothetical protein